MLTDARNGGTAFLLCLRLLIKVEKTEFYFCRHGWYYPWELMQVFVISVIFFTKRSIFSAETFY